MADTTEALPSQGSSVQYNYPNWIPDTSAQVAGGLQGMLGDNGYINQTMGNWYSAPLTAGYDQNSTSAYGMAQQPNPYLGQVQQGTAAGAGYLNSLPASQDFISSGSQGLATSAGMVGSGMGALQQASSTYGSPDWQQAIAAQTQASGAAGAVGSTYLNPAQSQIQQGSGLINQGVNYLNPASNPVPADRQISPNKVQVKPPPRRTCSKATLNTIRTSCQNS